MQGACSVLFFHAESLSIKSLYIKDLSTKPHPCTKRIIATTMFIPTKSSTGFTIDAAPDKSSINPINEKPYQHLTRSFFSSRESITFNTPENNSHTPKKKGIITGNII